MMLLVCGVAALMALVQSAPLNRACSIQLKVNDTNLGAAQNGMCTVMSDCRDGHFPSGPINVTPNMNQTLFVIGCDVGIGKFPNTYKCCARTYCQAPNGTAGVCVNSADCTGEAFTTANGAVGCYLHKAAVTCCVGGVNPTVAPVDVVEPFTAPPEGTAAPSGDTGTTDDGGLFPTMTRTAPGGGAAATTASLALVVLVGVAMTAL